MSSPPHARRHRAKAVFSFTSARAVHTEAADEEEEAREPCILPTRICPPIFLARASERKSMSTRSLRAERDFFLRRSRRALSFALLQVERKSSARAYTHVCMYIEESTLCVHPIELARPRVRLSKARRGYVYRHTRLLSRRMAKKKSAENFRNRPPPPRTR